MKFKKIEPARVAERVEISRVVCDFCKQEIPDDRAWEENEVEIVAKLGCVYPEGDQRERQEFDCCAGCWRTKIVLALEALAGAPVQKRANDDYSYRSVPWDGEAPDA